MKKSQRAGLTRNLAGGWEIAAEALCCAWLTVAVVVVTLNCLLIRAVGQASQKTGREV